MSLSAVTLLLKRCCRDSARVARSSTHFMGVQRRFATDAKHAKKKPTLEQVATPLGRQTQLTEAQMDTLGDFMKTAYTFVAGGVLVATGTAIALFVHWRRNQAKKAKDEDA
uniref:Uncharacterized protein n=1 Tax=Pinguiococcus pyrenoidosus TaxID=172671 RepID=A0A7R9U3A2_9STRA|mmetsp:Transcript_11057/g.41293  ORF Transcript_11057/g.41293 Transcript_11057/m.41293 type:complete len:111 (+) Transcript_11057:57-389(+)